MWFSMWGNCLSNMVLRFFDWWVSAWTTSSLNYRRVNISFVQICELDRCYTYIRQITSRYPRIKSKLGSRFFSKRSVFGRVFENVFRVTAFSWMAINSLNFFVMSKFSSEVISWDCDSTKRKEAWGTEQRWHLKSLHRERFEATPIGCYISTS